MAAVEGQLRGTAASKLPYGILSLLGIKSLGAHPLYLRDDYQPVLESLNMLAASHAVSVDTANFTLTAAAGAFDFTSASVQTVPQDEIWYAYQYTVKLTTGVGEALSGYVATRDAGSTTGNDVQIISELTTLVASQFLAAQAVRQPLWLPQGLQLGFFVAARTGSPTARLTLRVLKLKV